LEGEVKDPALKVLLESPMFRDAAAKCHRVRDLGIEREDL